MEFCSDNLIFSFQQFVAQKLCLNIFKAQTLDGIGETFSGFTLFSEQQDCFFDDLHYFFFRSKYRVQRSAVCIFLAPTSADIYAIAILSIRHRLEWAGIDAASAVVADILIDGQNTIHYFCSFYRTCVFNLANFASTAQICFKAWDSLSNDTQVVEVWFYAVVWTTAILNL